MDTSLEGALGKLVDEFAKIIDINTAVIEQLHTKNGKLTNSVHKLLVESDKASDLEIENKSLRNELEHCQAGLSNLRDTHSDLMEKAGQLQVENAALRKYLHGDCKACIHKGRGGQSKECQKCKLGSSYKWEFIEALKEK